MLQTREMEEESLQLKNELRKRDTELETSKKQQQESAAVREDYSKMETATENLRKSMKEKEKEFQEQLREANEKALKSSMLMRENEELRKEAQDDSAKYHRLMQGIVEAQEQRVRLETALEQERLKHREVVESKTEELQAEFDGQVAAMKDRHDAQKRGLELEKQKLEFETNHLQKELERQQAVIDAKSKEIRIKDKELAESLASSGGGMKKGGLGPLGSSSGSAGSSTSAGGPGISVLGSAQAGSVQQTLEIDHLRKKLADHTKRIEVLVCEKSALNLEIQNMSRRIDLESLGAEFREFAPRKVHAGIIKFDELCQQGLVYIQKTPNVRVCIFAYLMLALLLNLFMCARFLLFS
eukprot:g1128.t1